MVAGAESRGARKAMKSPFYTAEHDAFREVMRRFVHKEIAPFAHEWDEAGEFPRTLYRKAAEIGLLALGFPEEYGGVPADQFMKIVASQEGARVVRGALWPENLGACDHRAERRVGCRESAYQGAPRRRPLCRERREDLH